MNNVRRVLILCTGNSCRSQMAEGLINSILGDTWEACSAGVSLTDIHPLAVQVMSEVDIDITKQTSKSVDEFLGRSDLDLVITVCDDARETCPVFLNTIPQIHISFEDPAKFSRMSSQKTLTKFREVRDDITHRLIYYLKSF